MYLIVYALYRINKKCAIFVNWMCKTHPQRTRVYFFRRRIDHAGKVIFNKPQILSLIAICGHTNFTITIHVQFVKNNYA